MEKYFSYFNGFEIEPAYLIGGIIIASIFIVMKHKKKK